MSQIDNNRNAIINLMLTESNSQQLPKYFKSDLELDKKEIYENKSNLYIWCLRECGTQIFPVGIGAIPEIIEFYAIGSGISKEIKFYLININEISIKEILANEVEKYSKQIPEINTNTFESTTKRIREVLSNGVNFKLWGLFSYPVSVDQYSYIEWLKEFKYLQNKPMELFMEKAISYLNKFNKLAL